MTRERFERLVEDALKEIPKRFRKEMRNVAVVVEDEPSPELLAEMEMEDGDTLFGLYLGVLMAAVVVGSLETLLRLCPAVLNGGVANAAYGRYHIMRGGMYVPEERRHVPVRLVWLERTVAVAHVLVSRRVRRAAKPRDAWLLTAPWLMPRVSAICASDRSE